nr:MAG TPA: hypothetical protein [Caudoviricetes sp.]
MSLRNEWTARRVPRQRCRQAGHRAFDVPPSFG